MNYKILHNELESDPLARGYSGMSDQEAADDLNMEYRVCTREYVFGWEIFNVTDDSEYDLLTDTQKSAWDSLCAIAQIDTTSGVAKSREAELFGPGTITRTNLVELRNAACSRAAELGLPVVSAQMIENGWKWS